MKRQVLHSAGPDPSPQGPARTPSPFRTRRAGMGARDFLREWLSVRREPVGATERTFYPYLARFLSGLLPYAGTFR
jgi:hypothetical protein